MPHLLIEQIRRLVETADSRRTGGAVFVVARFDPTYEVEGVYDSEGEAKEGLRRAGTGFDVFGPYHTSSDPLPLQAPRLTGITLRFEVPAGGTIEIKEVSVDPTKGDALIWSLSAFDKFWAPYYVRLMGAEGVAELRRRVLEVGGFGIHILTLGRPLDVRSQTAW